MKTLLPLLPALALLLGVLPIPAEEKILVRQHWEPGKLYRYDLNIDTDVTGGPGGPGGGDRSTSVILQTEVTVSQDASADTRLAHVKATSAKVMIEAGGELKTFDSDNPGASDPGLQKGMNNFLGQTVTLVYDSKDTLAKVTLPDGSTLGSPDARSGPTGEVIGEIFREILTGALPTDPLALKEEFTQERRFELGPEAFAVRKHKGRLDSIAQPHATILAEGAIEILPTYPTNTPPGAIPTVNFKAETLFDLQKKAVHRATTNLDVKPPPLAGAADMSIKLTATLKSITNAPADKK